MNAWSEKPLDLLERMLAEVCPPASDETKERWRRQFLDLGVNLQAWSARFNITRIRSAEEIVVRHFVDSLLALPLIPEGATSLIDVGCGAGFPGLPIKICRPELEVAFLDSRMKAIIFVRHAAALLGLNGVSFHHLRAEQAARKSASLQVSESSGLAGAFDCATAKALAKPGKVLDICLPLLRKRGRLIAFLPSGGLGEEELEEIRSRGLRFSLHQSSAESLAWERKFLLVENGPG